MPPTTNGVGDGLTQYAFCVRFLPPANSKSLPTECYLLLVREGRFSSHVVGPLTRASNVYMTKLHDQTTPARGTKSTYLIVPALDDPSTVNIGGVDILSWNVYSSKFRRSRSGRVRWLSIVWTRRVLLSSCAHRRFGFEEISYRGRTRETKNVLVENS